jgi:hypothetical protein
MTAQPDRTSVEQDTHVRSVMTGCPDRSARKMLSSLNLLIICVAKLPAAFFSCRILFQFYRIFSFRIACKIWSFAQSETMRKTSFFCFEEKKYCFLVASVSLSHLFASKLNDRRTLIMVILPSPHRYIACRIFPSALHIHYKCT